MENRLFVTFIFVFENDQNAFSYGPPLGPFWTVKYLNFGQKLPIRTVQLTCLECKHPEFTKNPYCFVPRGINSWTKCTYNSDLIHSILERYQTS